MNSFILNLVSISLFEGMRLKLVSEVSSVRARINFINVLLFIIIILLYAHVSIYTSYFMNLIMLNILIIFFYKTVFPMKMRDIIFYVAILFMFTELIAIPSEVLMRYFFDSLYDVLVALKYLKLYIVFLHIAIYAMFLNRNKIIFTCELIHATVMKKKYFYKKVIFLYILMNLIHASINIFPIDVGLVLYTIYTLAIIIGLLVLAFYYTYVLNTRYIRIDLYNRLRRKYVKESREYGELRHNIINNLLAIKTSKYTDKVIDKMILKYKRTYQLDVSIPSSKYGLEGLIDLKMKAAKKLGVNVIYCKKDDADESSLKNVDYFKLCEVVGILIDNAIEASIGLDEKFVYVDQFNDNGFHMKIINNFKNSIDIDKMFYTNYSTKERSSGYGLSSINYLVKSGIKLKVNIVDNRFIASIDV